MAEFLLALPVLLFSVVAHEYAHAWTAYRQGDLTAHERGRLTLNPVPHIDPVMSVLVPALLWYMSNGSFTFGAARPVPVDPSRFRNLRRGDLVVSSAGIVANLALAVLCGLLFAGLGVLGRGAPALAGVGYTLQRMMALGLLFNVLLAFFNLIPIPPLDGSRLLALVLPRAWQARYRALAPLGFLILLGTMWLAPGVFQVLLWPATRVNALAASLLRGFILGSG